ncbi:S8 family serine peptidase [Streptomyces sp. NPDC058746]|uniref:S8 family serine peptidase n=1 Tax=Streptomyces sp. NPDC058746 TaxID=3346622 RepID=UPI0036C10AB4
MSRITINGVTVDPLAQAHELETASLVSEDATASNYLLVQTTHPPTAEEKEELAALGVVIHEYVPDDTYLCGFRPTDLDAVRALPFVAWADVYFKGFKIGQSLRSARLRTGLAELVAPMDGAASPEVRTVDVVLHEDVQASEDGLRDRIAAAAGGSVGGVRPERGKIRMTVRDEDLAALAALDEVKEIEEVPERVLYNTVAGNLMHAHVSLNGTKFRGEGQIVCVADTGFDKGSTTNVHPAFTGRVKRLVALGRTSPARTDDPDGHGTHVAGSVLGDGTSASMGTVTGTAPEARLVLQSVMTEDGLLRGIPDNLLDLFEPPFLEDGARIHTNSWGPVEPGLPYNQAAFEADQMVWQNKDFVILFAAGNSGEDRDGDGLINLRSVSGESGAKNIITVGASEGDRPQISTTYDQLRGGLSRFPAAPIHGDRMADNPAGMAAFSSRGPTQEGRIAPTVVAPGTLILSARSRVSPNGQPSFSTDPDYVFESGTSMATPLVAGCVAVLRETLVKNGTPKPSAALIKAMLVNGADELKGQYVPTEAGPSPNNNSGFGIVNLRQAVVLPTDAGRAGFTDAKELDQGEERVFHITVPQGATRLKVTLVWTDPPGKALQNDLDLIVRAGGQERHGNMGTGSGFDRVNNIEQVNWQSIPAGEAEVVVRAFRITQFAQPYAVAWRVL